MTPRSIWEPVLHALRRDTFDLDVFSSEPTRRNIPSRSQIVFPERDARTTPWTPEQGQEQTFTAWGNPPWGQLGWVFKLAASQPWRQRNAELVMLVPVRSHRRFWAYAMTSEVQVDLPPVAFVGEENSLSLPLCLLYWGPRERALEFASRIKSVGFVARRCPLTMLRDGAIVPYVNKQETIDAASRMLLAGATTIRLADNLSISGLLSTVPGLFDAWRVVQDQVKSADDLALACARSLPVSVATILLYGVDLREVVRIGEEHDHRASARLFDSRGMMAKSLREILIGNDDPAVAPGKPADEPREIAEDTGEPKATAAATQNSRSRISAGARKPPTNGRPPAKSAASSSASPPASDGGTVAERIEAFLQDKGKGDEFQTGDVLKAVSGSRASVARVCKKHPRLLSKGHGRAAVWTVVA